MRQATGPAPTVARRRPARLHRRHWLTPAVLLLVVVVVAVAGGFRAAPLIGPRAYAVGQTLTLQRWQLVVTDVDLVDTTSYGSPQAPALQVTLSATWTGDRSVYGLASGLVSVVVPGGPPADEDATTAALDHYTGGFDPDVARPVTLAFTWPAAATETSAPSPAPTTVLVVVSDERPAQNYLFSDEWVVTPPVGHAVVPVVDQRTRR